MKSCALREHHPQWNLKISQLSKLPNFYIKKAVPSKILLKTLSNLKCSIISFLNMFVKFEVCTSKLATVMRNLAIGLFLKNPLPLNILLLLQFLQHILQILHKPSQLNNKGPLEAVFLNFPPKIFLEQPKVKISSKNLPLKNFEKNWIF